jgi:LPXTG-motif cell wall-anchored protein
VANVPANIQTTGANGMLTFDNLTADAYYRLAELQSVNGYYAIAESAVLTMDGNGNIQRMLDDGTVAQLYDPVIQVTGPYNIQVTNLKLTPLPDTGGVGTDVYTQMGLLLMAVSLLLLYKRKRRREETNTS